MRVTWSDEATEQLTALVEGTGGQRVRLSPFQSRDELRRAVEGTLALDIRSPVQRTRHPHPGQTTGGAEESLEPFFAGDLWFQNLHFFYELLPEKGETGAAAFTRINSVEAAPDAGTSAAAAAAANEAMEAAAAAAAAATS